MTTFNDFHRCACVAILFSAVGTAISKGPIPQEMISASICFNKAVNNGDVNMLVKCVKFPIKSNEFGAISTQSKLKAMYSKIFTKERVKGLSSQTPRSTPDGGFSISSSDEGDPIRFLFKKFGTDYKMYCIDNINE